MPTETNAWPEIIAEAIDTLTSFCIPLYVDINDRPVLRGTGFFVNIETDCYLVSAAHVLDDALSHSMYFYSSPRQKRYLDGKIVRPKSADGRHNDRIDVGVVKLGSVGRPPFPEMRKFAMDLSYLKPCRVPRADRHYVIIGYPETKNRFRIVQRDILATPYAYRTDSLPDTEYKSHGVTPESHVLLPLNLRQGFDSDNRPVHFPKPQGMSGSPVFVLYEEDSDSRVFPVVAVGIEYRKPHRALVATDVQFVLEAIERAK